MHRRCSSYTHRNTFSVGRRDIVEARATRDQSNPITRLMADESLGCCDMQSKWARREIRQARPGQTRSSANVSRCLDQLESACCDGGQFEIDVCIVYRWRLFDTGVFLLRPISGWFRSRQCTSTCALLLNTTFTGIKPAAATWNDRCN